MLFYLGTNHGNRKLVHQVMNKQFKNITDSEIQALVDKELEWEEGKRVCEAISCNTDFIKRYNNLKIQKSLLQNWWVSKSD